MWYVALEEELELPATHARMPRRGYVSVMGGASWGMWMDFAAVPTAGIAFSHFTASSCSTYVLVLVAVDSLDFGVALCPGLCIDKV